MTEQLEARLLPCPFCGGEARPNTTRYSENSDTVKANRGQTLFHGVNCIDCGARTTDIVGHLTPQRAAAAWNRRATPAEPSEHAMGCGCCAVLHEVRELVAGVPGDMLTDQVRALLRPAEPSEALREALERIVAMTFASPPSPPRKDDPDRDKTAYYNMAVGANAIARAALLRQPAAPASEGER